MDYQDLAAFVERVERAQVAANEAIAAAEPLTGDVVPPVTVDMGHARGLVVAPDEILVIVVPAITQQAMRAHRAHLDQVLPGRYMLVAGDSVQLAKVKEADWASNAIEQP